MEHAVSCTPIATPGPSRAPFAALGRWWRDRRMTGELAALSDAALKDIGVQRCEIRSLVRARLAQPGGL
jgi:uncharacterized protein YjiS (DUF1127 family)